MAHSDARLHLTVTILILSCLASGVHGDIHSPCYGCQLFNIHQRQNTVKRKVGNEDCRKPCRCDVKELNCNDGVPRVKDGCGCCFMCARQHGDMCSMKDKCDASADLYCSETGHGTKGVCKASTPKPCSVNGVTYNDGAQFKPECSRLCTCQNGNYGCVSLCPQEDRKPSAEHCPNAMLLPVRGQCCKEWTCDPVKSSPTGGDKRPRHTERNSQALMMPQAVRHPNYNIQISNNPPDCPTNSSAWSPCSVTCGVGLSVRFSSDNCGQVQQTRLCQLRPCGKVTRTVGRKKCTGTTRSEGKLRIIYQDCRSVREFSMKFCTNCKRKRCCYPRKEETRTIEFECSGGRREYLSYMWIKSCRCDRVCYKPDGNTVERHKKYPSWLTV